MTGRSCRDTPRHPRGTSPDGIRARTNLIASLRVNPNLVGQITQTLLAAKQCYNHSMPYALLLALATIPIDQTIAQITNSGRVLSAIPSQERLLDPQKQIAPGPPPLLAFRYFDGADKHRFGKLDLMVDDAGH